MIQFKPIWAPDIQAKVISKSVSISSRYSIRKLSLRCATHRGIKFEIFTCLWLLLKRQSGEILLEVNTSIMKEKIWRKRFDLLRKCMYLRGVLHNAETTLWSRNRNRIMKQTGGRKSRDTLPLRNPVYFLRIKILRRYIKRNFDFPSIPVIYRMSVLRIRTDP